MFSALSRVWNLIHHEKESAEDQLVAQRLRERDERVKKLLDAGGGKIADFMHADFATHQPNGLEIADIPDRYVRAKHITLSDLFPCEGGFAGVVEWESDSLFYVSPPYKNMHGEGYHTREHYDSSVTTHEFTHTLQHNASQTLWGDYAQFEHFTNLQTNRLDNIERNLRKKLHGLLESDYSLKGVMTLKPLSDFWNPQNPVDTYYASNREIQARMNESLVMGYALWQRMPSTKIELWAALNNLGLTTPKAIQHEIYETEEGRAAHEAFRVNDEIIRSCETPVGRINAAYEWVGDHEYEMAMWEKIFPLLYGNLLEHYRDTKGRERMDMGVNPQPAIELLRVLKNNPEKLMPETIKEYAQKIPPSISAQLINTLIEHYPEKHRQAELAVEIVQNILERDEIRNEIFSAHPRKNYVSTQDWATPLQTAVQNGHMQMVTVLARAGADPFQKYKIEDILGREIADNKPLGYAQNLLEIESKLICSHNLPKAEKKNYANFEWRGNVRQQNEKFRRGLRALARIYGTDNPEFREILESTGIHVEDLENPEPIVF